MVNATNNKMNGSAMDSSLGKLSQDVGERLGGIASEIANSATGYLNTSRSFVKENPTKGILMATTAGILVGALFTLAVTRKSN